MAVIVKSTDSVHNDDLWNEWSDQLDACILDADANKNNDDELVNALFNVRKSNRFSEKGTTIGTLGDFAAKTEGEEAEDDTFEQGYDKVINHTTFAKTVTISRELAEDSNIDVMKARATNLVKSYKRSRAQFASNLLTSAGATTFTYNDASYDSTTGDGLALYSAAHTLQNVASGTESNLFTNYLTDATILNKYANVMRNYKDDKGHVLGLVADTIVVPGNSPVLEDLVKKIIGSDGEVGTNYNDINTQRGKWKLVVDHLWTPTIADLEASPFIIMSSEANKDLIGSVLYDRVALDVKSEVVTKSRNLVYNGYTRFSAGCYNWRHIIMGGVASTASIPASTIS